MVDLSVELPTYNEAENLPVLVERLENLGLDLEIVIIDDNSPDGTFEVAKSLSEKYGNIKILQRPKKLGLASAIFEGLSMASGEYIAVMDADLQHPPETLVNMFTEAKRGSDIIVASRYVSSGRSERFGMGRRLISRGATFLAHAMLRETRCVKDPMSGFFVFKRDVLEGKKIESDGYKVLLEVLVKGGSDRKIAEIPYTFRPRTRGKSKLTFKENLKFVRLLLMLSQFRPLKFISVGASGVLVNVGILTLLRSYSPISLLIAGIIAIESSIISNFVFNHLWTFKGRSLGNWAFGFLRYNLVALPGGIINLLTLLRLSVVTDYRLADVVGIALAFAVNYLGSELIVWGRALKRQPSEIKDSTKEEVITGQASSYEAKDGLHDEREPTTVAKSGER